MSSCLAPSGVCHAKKAGLSPSSHRLLVFLVTQRSLEVHKPHTDINVETEPES